jgi:hypothetical protein
MSDRLLFQPVPRVRDRADVRGSGRSPRQPGANTCRKAASGSPAARAKWDGELSVHIRQVFEDYFGAYARRFILLRFGPAVSFQHHPRFRHRQLLQKFLNRSGASSVGRSHQAFDLAAGQILARANLGIYDGWRLSADTRFCHDIRPAPNVDLGTIRRSFPSVNLGTPRRRPRRAVVGGARACATRLAP